MTTAQERKQQERHARRRRIQRAARTVFAEKSYAKASIEQIAREAQLSVGAIYLYFRSKEDLYVSLLEETLEQFDGDLSAIRQDTEMAADERLRKAWQYLVQWAAGDIEATRVLRLVSQPGVRKQLSDEVAEAVAAGIARIKSHLAGVVEDGMNASIYQRGNADETVDMCWALFLGILQSNDARQNLDLPGASFEDLARSAFAAVDTSLRHPPRAAVAAA